MAERAPGDQNIRGANVFHVQSNYPMEHWYADGTLPDAAARKRVPKAPENRRCILKV